MTPSQIAKKVLHEYRARDVDGDGDLDTLCNLFVRRVAEGVGCQELDKMLANSIVHHCEKRWVALDPDEAQDQANQGRLVIAGWANPTGGHGHVAVIIKGNLGWSKSFEDDVPMCANAGTSIFYGRPVSYAFKASQKPSYYMWPGESQEET